MLWNLTDKPHSSLLNIACGICFLAKFFTIWLSCVSPTKILPTKNYWDASCGRRRPVEVSNKQWWTRLSKCRPLVRSWLPRCKKFRPTVKTTGKEFFRRFMVTKGMISSFTDRGISEPRHVGKDFFLIGFTHPQRFRIRSATFGALTQHESTCSGHIIRRVAYSSNFLALTGSSNVFPR